MEEVNSEELGELAEQERKVEEARRAAEEDRQRLRAAILAGGVEPDCCET